MLTNKKIIIVGGSSGIGLQLASDLISQHAEVIIASRSVEKLERVAHRFSNNVTCCQLDASNEASVKQFFVEVGNFDHLIVTIKPVHLTHSFSSADINKARDAFDAKFWGQYYLSRHCLSAISPSGSILLTSGIASQRGYSGFSIVAAINGAVESLVKSLAVEIAPIRVNAVCPGFIERYVADAERFTSVKSLGAHLPLNRLGSHIEISDAYQFLLKNQYATGTILTVDGGELCA